MHPLWHVQGKPSTCQRCEVWTKLILGCRADLLGRKRRGFSIQHSVSHPSLQKGPGTGTSLQSHRNVLTDLKRLGIILCVLVSRKADSAFLLVLFKRVCGLAMCMWWGQNDHRLQLNLWCCERWGGCRLCSCITVDKEGEGGWVFENVRYSRLVCMGHST